MNQKNLVIGVDGGGTKTNIVCVDIKTKEIKGFFKTDSTNINNVGMETAKENLKNGILGSLQQANKNIEQVTSICLCMAGVDRPQDKQIIFNWVKEIFYNNNQNNNNNKENEINIYIHNDAIAALASGTNGILYGIVVISGTGMIVYGCNKNRQEKRSGGWGPLLGDEGSGYAIGMDILRSVVRAIDGAGPSTKLVEYVLNFLNLSHPSLLISWAYDEKSKYQWQKFANLAPLANQLANEGDTIANSILEHAANQLFINIEAVIKGLNISLNENFPLVFSGGNLTYKESKLSQLLKKKILEKYSNCNITNPIISPEYAAALLAINYLISTNTNTTIV